MELSRSPSVRGLFFWRSPATIAWRVANRAVNAIERLAVWARTHVSQERTEAGTPSIAYSDPFFAVPLIVPEGGVIAAANHGVPGLVLRRGFSSGVMTVFGDSLSDAETLHAAATASASTAEPTRIDVYDIPALTAASPKDCWVVGLVGSAPDDGQEVERLSVKIESQHPPII